MSLNCTASSNGSPTAAALLADLERAPFDSTQLVALAQFYLAAETSDSDRAALRAAVAARPELCAAFERFYRQDAPERDPLRHFVLGLAMIALTSGQPNPQRARAALGDLAHFARQHGIKPAPYLAEVASIAGPETAPWFLRTARRLPFRRFVLLNALLLALLVLGALLIEAALLPELLRTLALLVLLAGVAAGQLSLLDARRG